MPMLTTLDLLEARGLPRYIASSEIQRYRSSPNDCTSTRLWLKAVGADTLDHFNESLQVSGALDSCEFKQSSSKSAHDSGELKQNRPGNESGGPVMFGALPRRMALLSELEAETEVLEEGINVTSSTNSVGKRRQASYEFLRGVTQDDPTSHIQSLSASSTPARLSKQINHRARGLGSRYQAHGTLGPS